MWLFSLGKKIDKALKPYLNINSKRKIPVIVCYRDNQKLVKNKIIYNNGKIKYEFINTKAISCELTSYSIDKISEIPEVSFICLDHKATLCLKNSSDSMGLSHAKIFKITGKNIGIGIIDSGVYPHPDLTQPRNTIAYFKDLIHGHEKPYDDNGHGSFLCGCISSSGYSSGGTYMGVSPDANLCMVKAFDASGNGFMSDIIMAVDILLSIKDKHNIRILCLPFEFPYLDSLKINPLELILKAALEANISVIVPSGNLGPQPYSVYFPGNLKEGITVGSADCTSINIRDVKVSIFSGRGPTVNGQNKPDLVAPGINVTSLASDTSYVPLTKYKSVLQTPYKTMSGTSISCALIAGVCALILEKTPELTPSDLKSILCLASLSIGENKLSQGSGLFAFEKIIK